MLQACFGEVDVAAPAEAAAAGELSIRAFGTVNLALDRFARWGCAGAGGRDDEMCPPGYAGYRFPAEIISHAVWLYFRFPLSLRMVDELLAARGIAVSHETVRQCALKFGPSIANLASSTGRTKASTTGRRTRTSRPDGENGR